MKKVSMSDSNAKPKFCDQCGHSIVPLAIPYTERKCFDCDRTICVSEAHPNGGMNVRSGDKVVLPKEFLKVSLDPTASNGKLFRPGVSWFVQQLHFQHIDNSQQLVSGELLPSDLDNLLKAIETEADSVLQNSEMLAYLDLESEEGAELAVEHLKENQSSPEWHATAMGSLASAVRTASDSGNVTQAAMAANAMATSRAMLIFAQHLERYVWEGYRAGQTVFECASAAGSTPAESEAIKKLQPLFEELDEQTLAVWTSDENPIGPRINVNNVREETLLALAQWYLDQFNVRRAAEKSTREARRIEREFWIKVVGVLIAIVTLGLSVVATAWKFNQGQ